MLQEKAKAAARRVLVGAMEVTGLLPAARRRTDPDRAVVLRYHSVSHFDTSARAYRSASIAITPDAFARQMRFLADWYQVVPLGRLVDCLLEGEPFPTRAVAITFDDGYRDNYVHALPVLRTHGFPATVYVTTGAIGDGWRFWLSRVRYALLETARTRVDLGALGHLDLSSPWARENAVGRLTRQLKQLTIEERESWIVRLLAETGHETPAPGSDAWFMNWDELRGMAAAGIDIGAHTESHPILTRLSDASANAEIRRSKEVLEAGLGRPVHHFAYPNGGGVINHDTRIATLVRDAGFRSASTSVNGVLRRGADPFRLPRLGVAQRHAVDGFALNLERDRLFSLGGVAVRPRLLLVGPPPQAPGGISTCVRSLLSSAIGTRFEIHHLSPTGAGGYHQPVVPKLLVFARALVVCPALLLFRRPAIVQVHTAYGSDFWRSAPFVLLSWAARVPSVLIIHGSRFDQAYEGASAMARAVMRFVLRRPASIHVRGEYWRRVVDAIVPGRPIHVLPTTTEPDDEAAVAPALKWLAPMVLFVGGTSAVAENVRKGLPDLLAVVARLRAEVPGLTVCVVGPTSGDSWQEFLAPEATGHVQFVGSLSPSEIKRLYRTAAVFVLPSHAEGMPNVILEAMAHGLPIVATTVGSISEVVEHDIGGYLLQPGDGERLVTALLAVLKDPQLALRMGEHNRAVVRARFTNRHTADRLLASYAAIVSGRHRAS